MTKRNHSITFVPGYLWKSWRQWHRRDWSQKVPYATCSRDCQQLFHRQLNLSPLGCSQLVVGCWPLDGQVLGSSGANCWPICLRGAEAPQAPSRKGNLHLRKWRTSIHWRWSHTLHCAHKLRSFCLLQLRSCHRCTRTTRIQMDSYMWHTVARMCLARTLPP